MAVLGEGIYHSGNGDNLAFAVSDDNNFTVNLLASVHTVDEGEIHKIRLDHAALHEGSAEDDVKMCLLGQVDGVSCRLGAQSDRPFTDRDETRVAIEPRSSVIANKVVSLCKRTGDVDMAISIFQQHANIMYGSYASQNSANAVLAVKSLKVLLVLCHNRFGR